MKIKPFSGKKRCKGGETYTFKKGIAIVPGMRMAGHPVTITVQDFLKEDK